VAIVASSTYPGTLGYRPIRETAALHPDRVQRRSHANRFPPRYTTCAQPELSLGLEFASGRRVPPPERRAGRPRLAAGAVRARINGVPPIHSAVEPSRQREGRNYCHTLAIVGSSVDNDGFHCQTARKSARLTAGGTLGWRPRTLLCAVSGPLGRPIARSVAPSHGGGGNAPSLEERRSHRVPPPERCAARPPLAADAERAN
jgi:hypothetical protein